MSVCGGSGRGGERRARERGGSPPISGRRRSFFASHQLPSPPSHPTLPHTSLNKCGVISPRYDVSHDDLEDWVSRLLPSRLFGVIVLTTSAGIMDHEEARRKKVGGKILGFFY